MGCFPEASRTISSCTEERGQQWPFVKAENPPVRQVLAASLAPGGPGSPRSRDGNGSIAVCPPEWGYELPWTANYQLSQLPFKECFASFSLFGCSPTVLFLICVDPYSDWPRSYNINHQGIFNSWHGEASLHPNLTLRPRASLWYKLTICSLAWDGGDGVSLVESQSLMCIHMVVRGVVLLPPHHVLRTPYKPPSCLSAGVRWFTKPVAVRACEASAEFVRKSTPAFEICVSRAEPLVSIGHD